MVSGVIRYFHSKTSPPEQSFKDARNVRLEAARREERAKLESSLLGTVPSSKLAYEDYALDPGYIMRARIRDYQ